MLFSLHSLKVKEVVVGRGLYCSEDVAVKIQGFWGTA
jgi:hypothetical protein